MRFISFRVGLLALIAVVATVHSAAAVTLRIDYSKDSKDFFTNNAAARAALEKAASDFSNILEDTLSGIETPPKYLGSIGGEVSFHWRRSYMHPGTGVTTFETDIENPTIDMDADEVLVFVGGRDLPGGEIGLGGPGGLLVDPVDNGPFTAAENAEWMAMRDEFVSSVKQRQETSGFARWGGSIAFDNSTNWHFDHTTNPPVDSDPNSPIGDVYDFYSAALHELAHVLGFGAVDDDPKNETPWEALVSGTGFKGTRSNALYAPTTDVPLAAADDTSHWLQGIANSTEYDGTTSQKPLMVPSATNNVRSLLTELDVAALVDIGWEIDLPSAASAASIASLSSISSGSSSGSSISSSFLMAELADVAAVSANAVPEPGGSLLAMLAAVFAGGLRGRRPVVGTRR